MNLAVQTREDGRTMLDDIVAGLNKSQKTLPSKYFYDKKGSKLFEKICDLDEYYLTRTELTIMKNNIEEISQVIGNNVRLIELGSGSSMKTRLILDHVENIDSYIPVDISEDFLIDMVKDLKSEYPDLKIQPVGADYTEPFSISGNDKNGSRKIAYYPGSTIGNFTRKNAEKFIELISQLLGEEGGLLIGFDLVKDRQMLIDAYDDPKGVTAEFNKNILVRINKELGANFDPETFEHLALFDEDNSRIEMHLLSKTEQKVRIAGREFFFEQGETIHTENSHKYTLESFRELTRSYFEHVVSWVDEEDEFCIQYLTNVSDRS